MISYAIRACLTAKNVSRVVVSTDDEEIALLSERFGADVILRPPELANDVATLDPVVVHVVEEAEKKFSEVYDIVVTVQPTSPLVKPSDIERAGELFSSQPVDTVVSVVDDRHLCWTIRDNVPVPAYAERVNRQQLPPNFRETGAVIACRRSQLRRGTRIGPRVALLEMPQMRSFDIDSIADLYLCESILTRKRIVFAVAGYPAVGLGHAYRAVMLAHELVHYEIRFVCEESSELAADYIRKFNYDTEVCADGALAETIVAMEPDVIVNDILDTGAEYMHRLRKSGAKVVNFEDLGSGAALADLVVNALYPGRSDTAKMLVGPRYFCLRDEFLYLGEASASRGEMKKFLITFGGVDEGDLTARIADIVIPLCRARGVAVDIITGPGYIHESGLRSVLRKHEYSLAVFHGSTSRISDFMKEADAALTSGGRTVFELAALRVPTLVICQNERETTHDYASWDNGVINLGHRDGVTDDAIAESVCRVLDDTSLRREMVKKSAKFDLTKGKQRVIDAITALVERG